MVMQAVVDFRGIFTDVYIGWPGRVHDARIFSNSDLYQKGSNGQLFPDQTRTINGHNLPLVIVGDPAYPLEHAFGRLKGRWRCLLKRMDYHLDNVPHVIAACVVLHNICETLGDRCQDDWVVQEESNSAVNERESGNNDQERTATGTGTPTSQSIRDAFADYLTSL